MEKSEEIQKIFMELDEIGGALMQAVGVITSLPAKDASAMISAISKASRLQTFEKLKRLDELGALANTEKGWYDRAIKHLNEDGKNGG